MPQGTSEMPQGGQMSVFPLQVGKQLAKWSGSEAVPNVTLQVRVGATHRTAGHG